jgi:hypothetical protein
MDSRWLAVVLGVLGCCAPAREAQGQAAAVSAATGTLVFEGACDASGAVPLGNGLFVVGDDEDNLLRVYDSRRGGPPLRTLDLSPSLALPAKKRPPEADIEAATELGGRAYWLSSHGRSSSGKAQPSRLRFFATTAPADGVDLRVLGTPTARLLEDLLADPRLQGFGLREAAELAPKTRGGLNIEGMTAMLDGSGVLIGFRGPVPGGKALVVPLLNPRELSEGQAARLGDPLRVDLGGLGVRGISSWRGRYLLIGGQMESGGASRLFLWKGGADGPVPVQARELAGLNPEAFVSQEGAERLLVLSDDGSRLHGNVECKRLKDPAQKRFRGAWVTLP